MIGSAATTAMQNAKNGGIIMIAFISMVIVLVLFWMAVSIFRFIADYFKGKRW